jgi:hypothetical protein
MSTRSLTAAFGPRSACVAGIEYIERKLTEVVRRRSGPPALPLPPPRRLDVSIDEEPEPHGRLALPPARAVAITLDDAVAHDWQPAR